MRTAGVTTPLQWRRTSAPMPPTGRRGTCSPQRARRRTVGWFRGWVFGDWAVYRGWADRAHRLLDEAESRGVLAGMAPARAARGGGDLAEQRSQYEDVIALARQHHDTDLECEARTSLGMMLVFSGLVDEGMRHLDEALAALCAGDVTELPVLEGCLCGLFNACERAHDVKRAEQWLRAAEGIVARRNLVAVAGYCRAHHAGILVEAGRWDEAEAELTNVIAALPDGLTIRTSARCRLGDLRVRQGRFEEAEILLLDLDHHDDAVVPRATLHLARGRAEQALELLERRLAAAPFEPHVEAPLCGLLTQAAVALDDLAAARNAVERLAGLAADRSSAYVGAISDMAHACLLAAEGSADARRFLRSAMSRFSEMEMPFELARARLALARSIAVDRPLVAAAEAEAALTTFEVLGARGDARRGTRDLRSLGGPARTGPKDRGNLTRREQEVLELLAHGLSNAEIGGRLFISTKTVEHHVSRVLSKLGVRSRTEAALHAMRQPNEGQASGVSPMLGVRDTPTMGT